MTNDAPEVVEEFNTELGVIKAELYTEGIIKFYREDEDQAYNKEEFDSYEDAEEKFFGLDSQIIEKFYEPENEKFYTFETVCYHTVKAETQEQALEKLGEMTPKEFGKEMRNPEHMVADVEDI